MNKDKVEKYCYKLFIYLLMLGYVATAIFGVYSISQTTLRVITAARSVEAAHAAGDFDTVLEQSMVVIEAPSYLIPDRVLARVHAARCIAFLEKADFESAAAEAAALLARDNRIPYYYFLNGRVREEIGDAAWAAYYYSIYVAHEKQTEENEHLLARAKTFLEGK